jgi:hypothetical protein
MRVRLRLRECMSVCVGLRVRIGVRMRLRLGHGVCMRMCVSLRQRLR